MRVPAWLSKGPRPSYRLTISSPGRSGKGSLWILCYNALIPFMIVPLLRFNHLPKAPGTNTITLGIRISTYEFWRYTNIQTIASSPFVRTKNGPPLSSGFKVHSPAGLMCDRQNADPEEQAQRHPFGMQGDEAETHKDLESERGLQGRRGLPEGSPMPHSGPLETSSQPCLIEHCSIW